MEVCKNYKPEILYCPICNNKLAYRYSISNKLIYFTSGKKMRIRNLGYSCLKCQNPTIYFSQTANKFTLRNYTYSIKIICTIAKFKEKKMSREEICDYFYSKNIEISDRNVDNLYKAFLKLMAIDEKTTIPKAYEEMLSQYHQIRLSIDLVTVSESAFVIVYDYFTGLPLAFKRFNTILDPNLELFLSSFLSKDKNITVIASIRKDDVFIPLLKRLCPNSTRFIAFNKF
ncbi:MAG: hypothetical protein K2I77_01170 [Anaeroplasmataceae bacterium]|nr:hypothetical protein [Anaeroplasmataceae bacterium]